MPDMRIIGRPGLPPARSAAVLLENRALVFPQNVAHDWRKSESFEIEDKGERKEENQPFIPQK